MRSLASDTPLMRQYHAIRAQHPDAVLFFRLGDFYEMFDSDALHVSTLLGLTLTKRNGTPMCGVPVHTARTHIARLLKHGKKVALCEQVSHPVPGELTQRKVIEIISPGTAVEDDFLSQGFSQYLATVCASDATVAFSYLEVSTGAFFITSFPRAEAADALQKEFGRVQPSEVLLSASVLRSLPELAAILSLYPRLVRTTGADALFNPEHTKNRLHHCFRTRNLDCLTLLPHSPDLAAAGALIAYLEETTRHPLSHVSAITRYHIHDFVEIDDATRKNLEILQNLHDSTHAHSLFETLNYTHTAMGTRLLRYWLHHPLRSQEEIQKRLSAVVFFHHRPHILKTLRATLSCVRDVERLVARVALEKAHGRDLLALKESLRAILTFRSLERESPFPPDLLPSEGDTPVLQELYGLLEQSIKEDCPVTLSDGNLIKRGFSASLDELHRVRDNANEILKQYLAEERERTGIGTLKMKYNRMLGHFLEVSKGHLSAVPAHFIRRRSLSNADRFTTEQLSELEAKLARAREGLVSFEQELFADIRRTVCSHTQLLRTNAARVAQLDVLQSFAHAALQHGWSQPVFIKDGALRITGGRHPVVELHLPSGEFVPNDLTLSSSEHAVLPRFALITGPNMAGKSTFLRQTALICLIAQVGSFVPAEKAELTPVDRIFCRVGAADNLARGESTFLVEMSETAHILRAATRDSLVIMDEVGRGTATEDGLSIAQAVSEYLLHHVRAKTLFATHYHELSRLAHPQLEHLKLDVLETDNTIVFLKKVTPGSCGSSYGIYVARLAGLPESVLARACELLKQLQQRAGSAPRASAAHEADAVAQTEAVHAHKAASKDRKSVV